jgi:hypothetical protein
VLLWTMAGIFVLVWAIGLAMSYTLHGFIHVLVVLAVAVIAIRLFNNRRRRVD